MKKYTREEKLENRKKNKVLGIITSVVVGMFLCVTGYFIWNILKLKGIEDVLRYIGIAVLVIVCILAVKHNFSLRSQPKKYKFIVFILALLAIGAGEYFASTFISKIISTFDNMNKNTVTYTSKLITLKDSETTKKNIGEKKIGIISDEEDIEGYVLAQNIIKKQDISLDNIYDYDEYITMLNDLYDGEIDACFVQGNYVSMYKTRTDFEHIGDETKVLFKYSEEMEKKESKKKKRTTSVTEPFSILVMGVDSNDDEIDDWGLGDTVILITFNPKTLNATILSIPRDTYVPIACAGNVYSKITHANPYGSECVKETVENFTGITIDYYAKMNFKGVITLVDALGGIDVDVPYALCESNQYRSMADGNFITVDKGWQHLNGAQALALARNRKSYDWCGEYYSQGERNDFVRGQNQQLVIKGIINSAKNIRTANQFFKVLDAVGNTLETDLSRDQMLEFYNVFKDILLSTDSLTDANDVISMQRTYLNGSDGHLHDYLAGAELYEFLPSYNSLNAITKAMRVNLGLEKEEYATSFSFSIDQPYEAKIIGKDVWGGTKSYPQPEKKPETPTCGTNQELGADGVTCVCKSGYSKNSYGSCASDTEDTECKLNDPNSEASNEGGCQCQSGYEADADSGLCAEPQSSGGESGGGESGGGESGGGESGGESGGGESGGGSEGGE